MCLNELGSSFISSFRQSFVGGWAVKGCTRRGVGWSRGGPPFSLLGGGCTGGKVGCTPLYPRCSPPPHRCQCHPRCSSNSLESLIPTPPSMTLGNWIGGVPPPPLDGKFPCRGFLKPSLIQILQFYLLYQARKIYIIKS